MTSQPESLVRIAERSVFEFATRPVFGERVDGRWSWMTYRELGRWIDEVRGGLSALGVGTGDRVAIISNNSAAWAAAAYATYGLAATFVPMYEAQRHEDWEFILRDCEASVVFVRTPGIAAEIEGMKERLPRLRHVVVIEGAEHDERSLASLRRRGREHVTRVVYPDPEAIAGFIYTSGTTGKPKGVMLSHRNLVSNIIASTAVFPVGPDDRSVSFLPWAHVYGQTIELHIFVSVGASTAFNRDVKKLVDDLGEVRPTILVAVPRIFNRIYDGVRAQISKKPKPIQTLFHRGLEASYRTRHGEHVSLGDRAMLALADALVFRKVRHKFGGRLRYVISGSATLSHDVGRFIDALGLDVYEGYGLSETSPIVTANRPGARKLGSVGQVIPGVTVRIDEPHDSSQGGEIIVYGPNVMKGYHARPEENAKAFTSDGGLRTGDLGRVDEAGFLYITGRIKEQYKLENGKYVIPTPLEEQLALSPYIAAVMLHGADRPYNVALVVLERDRVRAWAKGNQLELAPELSRDPKVRELIAHELEIYGAELRSYERPRDFVITDEELTTENGMLTPSLKLKRQNVLAKFGAALEALYPPRGASRPSPAPERRAR
jgi:long-chain acyl-CoA synthetase